MPPDFYQEIRKTNYVSRIWSLFLLNTFIEVVDGKACSKDWTPQKPYVKMGSESDNKSKYTNDWTMINKTHVITLDTSG